MPVTHLTGAQVSGEKVTLDVGRNLTLTSEQDTDYYHSKQQNASAGGNISMSGGSGSVNLSRDKMQSTFETVQEQTGIFAGAGGFDITVSEHTQLNGAVIGSTAAADKNKIDTGTLGFSDIHNSAEYEVEHQSAGISPGGSVGGQFVGDLANGLLTGVNSSGSDSSTTKSAVSDGTITVRDQDRQTQDVNDLSRDVEHANQTLSPIFDKEKEQQRLQEAQLIGEIGSQVGDIARTQGQIEATKAGKAELTAKGVKEPGENATKEERAAYDKALTETAGYKAAQQKWGTGSAIQQGIKAATAAVQGLAGGDLKAALAGASAPYIAEVIKQTAPDEASRVMAHAAVAGVIAAAQGNSAAAGAAGAVTTAAMGEAIKNALYGDVPVSQLSEEQKQTLVALGSLAAGLAGGLTGDSTADAVAGAQAGQNSVNNNLFGGTEAGQDKFVQEHGKDVLSCADAPSSASCQRGEAVNKAIAVALGAGAAGGAVAAVTPELVATAQAAISACTANPVLCANEVSIWLAEMGMGDALPAGLAVGATGKITAEQLSMLAEMKTMQAVEKQAGSKVTKESVESVVSSKPSSGAENVATYPKLKDELVQQNLNNIAKQDPRLEIAIKGDGSGKKDFSMGKGSRAEADRLGQIWLGDGAKQTSGGGWISADGTRGYRSPSAKDSPFATTGTQANFETYEINSSGKPVKVGNGHLNILD